MRIIQMILLSAGLFSLAACSKPVPQALVGEWVCNYPAGTYSVLSDIKYEDRGDFVAHITNDLTISSKFSVDGDRISYPWIKDPRTLRHLPVSYQGNLDQNTVKFGFVDPVAAEPNMADCRRKN